MSRRVAAALLLTTALMNGARAQPPVAIPAEDFFRLPQITDAQLSPSGGQIGLLAGVDGARVGLFVFDLARGGQVSRAAAFGNADVQSFRWVNEDRLVFDVIDRQAGGGEQPFASGLFSVKSDGSELRQLVQLTRPMFTQGGNLSRREPLSWNHMLLHVSARGGDEVIVGKFVIDNLGEPREVQPFRLNVVDGRALSLATGMPDNAFTWLFDAQGEPRVAITEGQGKRRMMWRESGGQEWTQLAEFDGLRVRWTPVLLDKKGTLYVTRSGERGHSVLATFDVAARKLSESFVSTPGFDFSGSLVTSERTGEVLGVHVTTDASTTVWFSPEMKRVQALVDARLPGLINRISCRRCGEPDQVLLVRSWSDREPGLHSVYDAGTGKWTTVGRAQPQIDARRMATVSFERIKARDGREMPLWLTLPADMPPGKRPASPRPTVLMVHGGPWVRGGHWSWQPMEQFLASRGYVVISPEFRGSTGYGWEHFHAGWRQWGLKMQDDIADALQWAVKQGYADGKRVCIAGASYGGYATLMGLVRHPELYRCGVAWLAVTEVPLLFNSSWQSDMSEEARRYRLPTLIGDPQTDAELLRDASPVTHAERIKAPLMLAFGQEDRRVPIEHGDKMRVALRAAGNEPEWIVYAGEGHGWLRLDHRVDFAQRVEKFLARHLRE
jgi:acetyl esterase/lipase